MATHIHRDTAPGTRDVPEVLRMGAVMLFRLLDQSGTAERAFIEQRFEPQILGRETQFLGVHQFNIRLPARLDHAIRFGEIQTQGFLHHDMLARSRRIERNPAMKIIRHAHNHHVDVRQNQQFAIVSEMAWNAMPLRKGECISRRRRSNGADLGLIAGAQRLGVDGRDELRANQPDSHSLRRGHRHYSRSMGLSVLWWSQLQPATYLHRGSWECSLVRSPKATINYQIEPRHDCAQAATRSSQDLLTET